MSLSTHQQVELKIQKEIRQSEDNLVIWIQAALDNKQSYGGLEESQFRNLVRVADTTDSPEVVKNFLRYQMGREKKWGRGRNSLAETIITDIDGNLKTTAQTISQQVDSKQVGEIQIELIRRYLGYGARYLTYLNNLNKGKE
jgi:hypothetical protein